MLRGLSPCAMAMSPSMIISRTWLWRQRRGLELVGDGQQEQVGEADAVGTVAGKGRRNAMAELGGIGKVLHDSHEAEHGAMMPSVGA